MRIRFKPWARPELEASKFYIDNPESYKGKWKEIYKNNNPQHLELGCGKGGFISELAVNNLDVNYVAVDLVDAMLGIAKRKIEEKYRTMNCPLDNIYITRYDIERIDNIFSKEDEIKRIYINFCNPWTKGKHIKKRSRKRVLWKTTKPQNRSVMLSFRTPTALHRSVLENSNNDFVAVVKHKSRLAVLAYP